MAPKRAKGGATPASPASASPASPGDAPGRLTVALVRGLRGLRGHVRVELLTDRPEDRFAVGSRLIVEGTPQVLTVAESSAVADGPGWWLRFKEIPSREAADTLRDRYLEIEPPPEPREPGQWFFHELIGLRVLSTDGDELGTVTDIYRAGGAEVFVVRGPRGEIDVPGVKAVVVDLAPDRGEMVVDLAVLDLDARPVDDEDYVRPRDRRPRKQPKPKGPAQPPKGTQNAVKSTPGARRSGDGKPADGTPPAGAETTPSTTPSAAGASVSEPASVPGAAKAGQPAKAAKPAKAGKPAQGSGSGTSAKRAKPAKGAKASGTYTLTADEIAEAMAAAGRPLPATALPRDADPDPTGD